MPYYDFEENRTSGGLWNPAMAAGNLLNAATSAVCEYYDAAATWIEGASAAAGVPGAIGSSLAARPIFDRLCQPYGGASRAAPPFPAAPDFPTPCLTYGYLAYRFVIDGGIEEGDWGFSDYTWSCSTGLMTPTSGWYWFVSPGGTGQWRMNFLNAGGGNSPLICEGYLGTQDRNSIQVLELRVNYCPSCNLPDPPPPIPEPPVREVPPDPEEPPIIPININFPRGFGLPDIVVPVSFSPVINVDASVSTGPVVTLAPRVDLNPDFSFAPNIEFNLGGISIGGGGYPEPVPDVEDIAETSCPDPCPDPVPVDYSRIQRIAEAVARTGRALPGDPPTEAILSFSGGGVAVKAPLSTASRWIQWRFNLTAYRGGETAGIVPAHSVNYPGWLYFARDSQQAFAGGRIFLNFESGYMPVPAWAELCYVQCADGATVNIRVFDLDPIGEVV